jgi:hypothetical protein
MNPHRRLGLGIGLTATPLFKEQVPFRGGLQVKWVQPEIGLFSSIFEFVLMYEVVQVALVICRLFIGGFAYL